MSAAREIKLDEQRKALLNGQAYLTVDGNGNAIHRSGLPNKKIGAKKINPATPTTSFQFDKTGILHIDGRPVDTNLHKP